MSTTNQLERDQVCFCPRSYFGDRPMQPSKHDDDCPFFSDNSHAESENEMYQANAAAEYVF